LEAIVVAMREAGILVLEMLELFRIKARGPVGARWRVGRELFWYDEV